MNPDFTTLVSAYGIMTKRVSEASEVEAALKEALASDKPYFIEFTVSDKESTL